MKGLSLTIAIGKFTMPHIQITDNYWRVCLGFIAIQLWFLDVEAYIEYLIKTKNKYEKKRDKIKRLIFA